MMPMSNAQPVFERVLLTNDDGFDAPGLHILEKIAATLAREVWVVAPELDRSGTSQSLSIRTPLRLRQRGPRRFSLAGSPADCVAIGVRHVLHDRAPDAILSGVNRGANLGRETMFSGTLGAALTGCFLGLPAFALSQAFSDRNNVSWNTALSHAPSLIAGLHAAVAHGRACCININFPDVAAELVKGVRLTTQGMGTLDNVEVNEDTLQGASDYHRIDLHRSPSDEGDETETWALHNRYIAVTPLHFDRTDHAAIAELKPLQLFR